MLRRSVLFVVVALVLGVLPAAGGRVPARAQEAAAGNRDVIVVLAPRADPSEVTRRLGIDPTFVYRDLFPGFAARVSAETERALRQLPGVALVSPDLPVRKTAQTLPAGVDRIDADESRLAGIGRDGGAVDADVAVLDTGIDPRHDDLSVAGGKACAGRDHDDGDGHGTHVAGTIGAKDNQRGVVGVAPGARLWAVKVLNDKGSGSYSTIICGLDWVVRNQETIDVVNMSLGGPGVESTCDDDAFHRAVCRVVAAGIAVVVAAGNESAPANASSPANFDEAITVSAFADSDGRPGGEGEPTCAQNPDDAFSRTYSNYGPEVDIAAPGDCIPSTFPGDRYRRLTGTSMATPHVAGAVALFRSQRPNASPAEVRDWLLTEASRPQTSPQGFAGDIDSTFEPVLYLGGT